MPLCISGQHNCLVFVDHLHFLSSEQKHSLHVACERGRERRRAQLKRRESCDTGRRRVTGFPLGEESEEDLVSSPNGGILVKYRRKTETPRLCCAPGLSLSPGREEYTKGGRRMTMTNVCTSKSTTAAVKPETKSIYVKNSRFWFWKK